MKQQVLHILLTVCLAVSAGSTIPVFAEEEQDTETFSWYTDDELTEILGKTVEEMLSDVDLSETVTPGTYKGLELTKEIAEVTDEDVDEQVEYALSLYPATLSRGSVQEGDTVNINYYISCDGEDLYNGSGEEKSIVIGKDELGFDGFDEGLIGASIGDTVTFSLEMPEDYTDLGGKTVDCEVVINYIQRSPSEITEAWVQENSDYETVEEFREGIREGLTETAETEAESTLAADAWQTVVSDSEISEYPENLMDYGKALYQKYLEAYASDADMELDEYLESKNLSAEDYEEAADNYAKNIAGQILVSNAIKEAEGFTKDDEEYQEIYQKYVDNSGLEEEEFVEQVGEDSLEQIILLDRISSLILENAVIS